MRCVASAAKSLLGQSSRRQNEDLEEGADVRSWVVTEISEVDPHPAVLTVTKKAQTAKTAAEGRLSALGVDAASLEDLAEHLRSNARLTLNFHPDRRDSKGRTVAAGLLADGKYRSQFETGISNGARLAVPGGDRTQWEHDLFDGTYQDEQLVRPVYGALDLFHDPYGGSPRFGSCLAVLEPHCLARATLCVGDSHLGPADLGTATELSSILAGAIEDCSAGDGFGRGLSVKSFLDGLTTGMRYARSARELDRYIEAQVHGDVDLAHDVASVLLDPSFRGSAVEHDVEAAAQRYGFNVGWNDGSEVSPEAIDPKFRGSDMISLARRTARSSGLVDAAAIGVPLATLPFTAPSRTGDSEESELQRYKKLWHCCLKYGNASA